MKAYGFSDLKKKSDFLLPSLGESLLIILFLQITVHRQNLLRDADTGWHIRIGDFILNNFSIPRSDIFSFVKPPLPWVTPDWLSEVSMALIHQTLGLTGVALFSALMISLLYYLLFRKLRQQEGNIILDVLIILMVMITSKFHWMARPYVFSLLLFLASYHILETFQTSGRNYLYFLPGIMLLWTNLHGAFITGFILIAIYLICNIIMFCFSRGARREEYNKRIRRLGIISIICLLSSLVNPFGYNVLLYTFKVISNRYITDHFSEFLAPNFHSPSMWPFEYLFLIVMVVLTFARKELRFHELLLILCFTIMSLYSVRNILFFAIIVAPILSRHSNIMINKFQGGLADFLKKRSENIARVDASAKGYIWVFPLMLIAAIVLSFKLETRFDEGLKPVAAVEFLKKEFIKGNMFNHDELGDYLIYSAYPQYKVFIHDKVDWLAEEKLREYEKVITFGEGWEEIIKKYEINWIIFETDNIFSRFLKEREDWELIYTDKVASIFVRNIPENFDIIRKHRALHNWWARD